MAQPHPDELHSGVINKNLRHATVRSAAAFRGIDRTLISLVGQVSNIRLGMAIEFTLGDGTGTTLCNYLVEGQLVFPEGDDEEMPEMGGSNFPFEDGQYVEVFGQLGDYFVVREIHPVTDHNQITHHFLQAIYEQKKHQAVPLGDPQAENA